MVRIETIAVSVGALLLAPSGGGKASEPKPASSLEATLSAKEKAFFQAWKDGHPEVFKKSVVPDGIFFGEYGVTGKSETVADQARAQCDVKSFTLTDFHVISVTARSAVLTYRAEQHGNLRRRHVQSLHERPLGVREASGRLA